MLDIKTGYFAKTNVYKEKGYLPVSIARFTPKGVRCTKAIGMAPSAVLMREYKSGELSEDTYRQKYLDGLNMDEVLELVESFEMDVSRSKAKGVVLMCYETPEKFCHRHILAEVLTRMPGIEPVEELTV